MSMAHITKGLMASVLRYGCFIYVILSSSMQAYDNGAMNERALLQVGAATITDIVYGSCDSRVYYQNTSEFATNLRTVLSVLYNASSSNYSASYGLASPSNETQSAYATYECRRDLLIQECRTCVDDILTYYCTYNGTRRADLVISAITIMLQGCYFRYSNRADYLQALAADVLTTNQESCGVAPVPALQAGVTPALHYVRTTAPNQTPGSFFASVAVVDARNVYPTVYALAQCLSFLSPAECAQCLDRTPMTTCVAPFSTYTNLAFYLPLCFYVFNTSVTVAFNSKYTTIPLNSSSSGPPPPPSPPPPFRSPPPPSPPPSPSPPLPSRSPPPPSPSPPPRSPPPPPPPSPVDKNNMAVIVGVSAGGATIVFLIIFIVLALVFCCRRRGIP